jgi:hypothetical protein
MTQFLDKLNLRPGERRLVVFVAVVVFVVLNIWLVWPSFGEWGRTEQRIVEANKKLKTFKDELGRRPAYEKQLRDLREQGLYVASDDQALQMQKEVTSQAALSGFVPQRIEPSRASAGGRTNSFFEEQTLVISVNTAEKELVDFLWNLGERSSLIRVRSMQLGRDPSQTRLQGTITLVESFQKKPPPKIATATAAAAAAKTAAPPAKAAPPPKTTNPPTKMATPPKGAPVPPPKTALATPPVKATNTLAKPTDLPKRNERSKSK